MLLRINLVSRRHTPEQWNIGQLVHFTVATPTDVTTFVHVYIHHNRLLCIINYAFN